jgi:plasmid replication initiation protein
MDMADNQQRETEISEINTPETLGVTPRYVLQHHAISRSIHSLSATAKKLTAMAMALLPPDLASRTAAFTFTDFCNAIGYDKGGESYKLFKSAVNECMKNVITIEISLEKGKKKWEKYTWFSHAAFDEETGKATMTFAPEFAAILLEMKRVYAKINLRDLGELQSKYALRIFEIAKSYESLKGKDGNRDEKWYFERDVQELREMLGVPIDTYKETRDFRKFAIENPVKEINDAGIGLTIATKSVKQGRKLAAVRFDCEQAARTVPKKSRKQATPPVTLPEPDPKTAAEREEKELEHLMELYPEEFAVLYEEELNKPHPFLSSANSFRQGAAKAHVLVKLREKYGIVK